jgi:hypothetical protein
MYTNTLIYNLQLYKLLFVSSILRCHSQANTTNNQIKIYNLKSCHMLQLGCTLHRTPVLLWKLPRARLYLGWLCSTTVELEAAT